MKNEGLIYNALAFCLGFWWQTNLLPEPRGRDGRGLARRAEAIAKPRTARTAAHIENQELIYRMLL
jgi:hypothetical protein